MIGLSRPYMWSLFESYGYVKGKQLNTHELLDLIIQLITENNESIEQNLIEEGIIKEE